MSDTAELVIALLAKDAASAVLGHVGDKLGGLGKAGDVAKLALAGLTAGLGVAVVAGLDFARAAADEEQGVARLRQAINNTGRSVDELRGEHVTLYDQIEENIAGFERLTAFSDGEMRDALSLLVGMTGDLDTAMDRLPTAMDLARGAGLDLATASKLLGKLTDENVGVLKRYGVVVKDGADATDVLLAVQQKFGGQSAAFADTAAGKWKIFNNQLDNLKEDIGSALLPLFSDLATIATGAIDAIRGALANPEIQGALQAFLGAIGTVKTILGEMFGVITGSAPFAGAALKGVVGPEVSSAIMQGLALIRDTFQVVFAIVKDVLRAFKDGDWGSVLDSVREGALTIGERLQSLAGAIGAVIGKLGAALIAALPGIRDTLLQWGKAFVEWLIAAVPPMLAAAGQAFVQLVTWIGDHSEEIGATLVSWGLQFGHFLIDVAIPKFLEIAPQLLGTIVHWIIFDAAPAIVRAAFNLGKGLVGGIADAFGQSVSAIADAFGYMIRQAISRIDFWVGPFHISGTSGITIQMPSINLGNMLGFGGAQAAGGDYIVSRPTMFVAGDAGPERATFTPLGRMSHATSGDRYLAPITLVMPDGRVLASVVSDVWVDDARGAGAAL